MPNYKDVVLFRSALLPGLLLAMLFPFCTQAASHEQAGFLFNEQQLREQQQRLRMQQRERLLRELERSLPPLDIPAPPPVQAPAPASDVCFTIRQIDFEGAENMLRREQQALQQDWLGKCMTLADIDTLRSRIEKFYIERGWIMARAYLKPGQNIRQGALRYIIREGKLDSVKLNFNHLTERMQAASAFAGMLDESLYLRDIEQGMDQINRLPSNRATMKIEPVAERAGYSRLLVNNVVHNPLRLSLAYDNQGSQSTGAQRGSLSLDSDNLLSVNDRLTVNVNESVEGKSASSNSSYSINLSLPYGYWLYTLEHNRSQYRSTNRTGDTEFVTRGDSQTDSVRAARVVYRDKTAKTTAEMALHIKDTETFLQDVQLQTGTRKLVVADMQLQHVERLPQGNWTARLTYSRGLSALGALLDDPLDSDSTPRAQFEKLGWQASLLHGFQWRGARLQYSGVLAGQFSRDPLFGSEQFAIGNLGSVRGFRDSPASGDSGLYLKNDLIWHPVSDSRWLRGLRVALGLDAGAVRVLNNNINNTGRSSASLSGVALAVQQQLVFAHDQQLDWSLTVGKGIQAPAFIDRDSVVTLFRLGWKFW